MLVVDVTPVPEPPSSPIIYWRYFHNGNLWDGCNSVTVSNVPDYSRLDEVLGKDAKAWPIHCLVQYPSGFDAEIDKFVSAVRLAVQGSIFEAREVLSNIKSQDLSNWFIEVGQNTGIYRMKHSDKSTSKQHSGKRLMWPKNRESEVLERDAYRCSYCQIRLMHHKQLEAFAKLVGKDVFPNGRSNTARHGIRLIMRATFDHVVPVSHDSDEDKNVLENVVASCWSCNFGKWYFTNEELGLSKPRVPIPGWDGLTGLLSRSKNT